MTDFNLPNLSTMIYSTQAILFPEETVSVADGDRLLALDCSKETLNKIFLFRSSAGDNSANDVEINDVSSAILYSMNVEQWNPVYKTSQEDRLWVFKHLLEDLFGFGGDISGGVHAEDSSNNRNDNIDALTLDNQRNIDTVIVNEFLFEGQVQQRDRMYDISNGHGAFKLAADASLNAVNILAGIIAMGLADPVIQEKLDAIVATADSADDHLSAIASNNNSTSSITKSLLHQAARDASLNPNKDVLSRQFDGSNDSTLANELPQYWRTFQFVEGDKLIFNIVFEQHATLPAWSSVAKAHPNDYVAETHNSITTYKVQLTVKNDTTLSASIEADGEYARDICAFPLSPDNEEYQLTKTPYTTTPGVVV